MQAERAVVPRKNVVPVTLYIKPEDKERLERLADRENRTVSGQAAHIILRKLDELDEAGEGKA